MSYSSQMSESIFTPPQQAIDGAVFGNNFGNSMNVREVGALRVAMESAIVSAFQHGEDVPVGAAALKGDEITGLGYAADKMHKQPDLHAEAMTILDSRSKRATANPDTVVVTLEPCTKCQDFLADQPGIKVVAFGLSRSDAAERGILKPHAETIFERANRVGLPYEVRQVEDEQLRTIGLTLLDHVERNLDTEAVSIDTGRLLAALTQLKP